MRRTRAIGLGAGGHAGGIIEILRLDRNLELVGLLDEDPELKGRKVHGLTVLGDDRLLARLTRKGVTHFFVGVGSAGRVVFHRLLYEFALGQGLKPVSAVHDSAVVSPSATLGAGIVLMPAAVVNHGASIGDNVIINTGAIVEHDCVIGDHAHVASGACLAGAVRVGANAHVGAGATVRQGLGIGDRAVVGAGAVVVKNVRPGAVVVGVPARERRKRR